MDSIEPGVRRRRLCAALLLGLSTGCSGKVDSGSTSSDGVEILQHGAGGPATGQGGAANGSCEREVPSDAPIVCSATSGPSDAVFKGCVSDSDCELLRYQDDCSNPNVLTAYGVAISRESAFRQCFPLPTCTTVPNMKVETRGEDGSNNLDAGPRFAITCEKHGSCAGRCMSSIP